MTLENIILQLSSILLWGNLLARQIKASNYLLITFLVSFALQYILPPLYFLAVGNTDNRYFDTSSTHGDFMLHLSVLVFLLSLYAGLLLFPTSRARASLSSISARRRDILLPPPHTILEERNSSLATRYYTPTQIPYKRVKAILLIVSLLAIVVQYKSFKYLFSADLIADRLIYNQGKGYLQLINIASYFLVFIGIKQYCESKISFQYLLLHAVPAFIIYALKLQRGHSVYPLFFIFVTYAFVNFKKKYLFPLFTIILLAVFYIGPLTSELRKNLVSGRELTLSTIKHQEVIPASFAHAELLSATIEDPSLEKDRIGVFWGTLVNFIPRVFFSDKPTSLGPVLSSHYSADSYQYTQKGNHRSSFTTDLLIEGYYYAGLLGIFLLGFVYCLGLQKVWLHIHLATTPYAFLLLPLGLFLWGYTIFFTDLGNWMGYIVLYYFVYMTINRIRL